MGKGGLSLRPWFPHCLKEIQGPKSAQPRTLSSGPEHPADYKSWIPNPLAVGFLPSDIVDPGQAAQHLNTGTEQIKSLAIDTLPMAHSDRKGRCKLMSKSIPTP